MNCDKKLIFVAKVIGEKYFTKKLYNVTTSINSITSSRSGKLTMNKWCYAEGLMVSFVAIFQLVSSDNFSLHHLITQGDEEWCWKGWMDWGSKDTTNCNTRCCSKVERNGPLLMVHWSSKMLLRFCYTSFYWWAIWSSLEVLWFFLK